jgi:hypothetical protein
MAKKGATLIRATARARISLDRRPVAHFLHIGKTAGTAVKVALKESQGSASFRVVVHRHKVGLADIPRGDHYFFCVRDPIDRYVSGFLSRQRQGEPRYHLAWSEGEADAFARFHSPDALAVSLGAGGADQRDAEEAMCSIRHVRSSYWDWFDDPDYFRRRADRILWVGHQESLNLLPLAAALNLESLELPTDSRRANRSLWTKPELSEVGRRNLRQWYAKDYAFLELCHKLQPEGVSPGPRGRDTKRNLVGRVMCERPFALRNADAFRLTRVARSKHHGSHRSLPHLATFRRHR